MPAVNCEQAKYLINGSFTRVNGMPMIAKRLDCLQWGDIMEQLQLE